ncbi:MAG: RNA polymerase sigma factor [Pseudomonadota bacterium]
MAKVCVSVPVRPLDSSFLEHMDRLRQRLIYRTGSTETGEDLLHDVWFRLCGKSGGDVQNPGPYLSRIADNLAIDALRYRERRLETAEIDQVLRIPDDAPSAERAFDAREELNLVTKALSELPARRREIFLAARIREERYAKIAARYRISTRTVENEVRRTLDHLAARLGELEI